MVVGVVLLHLHINLHIVARPRPIVHHPQRHNGQPCGPNPNAEGDKDVRYDV